MSYYGRTTESHLVPLFAERTKPHELRVNADLKLNEFQVIFFSRAVDIESFLVVEVSILEISRVLKNNVATE